MVFLKADKREVTGKKVGAIRLKGFVPANIFGKKVKSLAVTLNTKDFLKVYKDAGETGLIEVGVGSEKKPVLIHNVQVHPVTDEVLHVDLLQVDLKEKVTAQVPVELIGESSVEKQGLGTLVQYVNEVEVKSLPADIPEKFEINAEDFKEVGQSVQIKNLKYNTSKVEISSDPEQILVKVEPPKKVEEEVAPVPTEVPAEVSGEVVETPDGNIKDSSQEGPKEPPKSD